jgi:hypothetical protein
VSGVRDLGSALAVVRSEGWRLGDEWPERHQVAEHPEESPRSAGVAVTVCQFRDSGSSGGSLCFGVLAVLLRGGAVSQRFGSGRPIVTGGGRNATYLMRYEYLEPSVEVISRAALSGSEFQASG